MSINYTTWHDRVAANHKKETDNATAQGFRTVSLCVYGERNDPRYAAVMVKRSSLHQEQQFCGLSGGEFDKKVNEMSAKGFIPYLVTATGPAINPLIAASFRPMKTPSLTCHGITQQQLVQLNLEAWRDGLIPASIDAYGTPEDVRFIAVWHQNSARVPWNLEAVSEPTDLATFQARFNAITAQISCPVFVAMTPENKFLGLFVDNVTGSWGARGDLTSVKYQQQIDTHVANGFAPIRVMAQGTGANTRFSVVFNTQEETTARVFSKSKSTTSIAEIDGVMEKFMKDHSMRGCALAITQDTRLVYVKGYTNAEPGYKPVVEPTTLFRLASVSKLFAAAAIYRLIQQGVTAPDGKPFTLDTTMQSVLNLKTPDGKAPLSPQFKDIKIRHLMESTSALEQGLIFHSVQAAKAFNTNPACLPHQLASYCASFSLQKDSNNKEKKPGDKTNVVYGNLDYFMLSQVVAKLCKTATFEDALNQTVLSPLGIKRVRGSRSLLSAQAADEARYDTININPEPKFDKAGNPTGKFTEYPPSLWIGPSSLSNDRPLVPNEYGVYHYEIFDGCGGLSGAVTDIARFIAALSLRKNNPAFSETTLDTWFQNAVDATAFFIKADAHGAGHGFDSGGLWNPNKSVSEPGNFGGWKGGWLPSNSSSVIFTSGSLSFIVVANSCGQNDVKTGWYSDLNGDGKFDENSVLGYSLAHYKDWEKIDLFPQFGMPSFKTTSSSNFLTKLDLSKILKFPENLRETNGLERRTITEHQTKPRL